MRLQRNQLTLLTLSGLPLLLGSGFALLVLDSSVIGSLLGTAQSYTLAELTAKKLMVAFVVSPLLYFVFLFLGEAFLLILFKGSGNIFQGLISILSLGIAMLSLAMILMDAIPPNLKNLFVAFYGSIFGIFLGIIMVTSTMFVLIVSLIAEDFLLTRFSPVAEEAMMGGRVGEDPFDYTRIKSEGATVGVGDFVALSLLSAHAVVYFPIHVWIMSLILGFTGVAINVLVLAREGKILPGIPVPAILGIFPWIIHLMTLALI